MPNEYGPKGTGVLFSNTEKAGNQPDYHGRIDLTQQQLRALVDLAKELKDNPDAGKRDERTGEILFELSLGVWDRVSKGGSPYLFVSTEVSMKSEKQGNNKSRGQQPYRPQAAPKKKPWER